MKPTINRTLLCTLGGCSLALLACNGDGKTTTTSGATLTSSTSEGTTNDETTSSSSGTGSGTETTDSPTGSSSESGTTVATSDAPTSTDATTTETSASTTTPMTSSSTGEPAGMCGWDPGNNYYECGFEGEDPGGMYPIACPDGLVEGEPCGEVSGEGCCDANSDLWYCGEDGMETFLVYIPCG